MSAGITLVMRDRSMVEDIELRGGLDVQHRPLFFVDLRVIAPDRESSASGSPPSCVPGRRRTAWSSAERRVRHGLFGLYGRRVQRGEGNPLPSFHKGVFASTELAAIWHLPSIDYSTVPFARGVLPVAPAPPAILRPADGVGTLRDALGPVSIHPGMRKQNTAVPGTVEQGKSSYLVATVAEDLRRERCAVIVLDPKGDAAEAAVSLVPEGRTCTLLDLSQPTCGFNPLAVDAPADVIADYVVAALKNLFDDADIRASSDRYLRNAIIAVLAYDRESTLWDAARLLSVGEEGYSYRARVGARVRALPEFKEISEFFTAELTAQLADARSMTTAKLDAPVNKLARLLNSQSIKRVLLNDSLRVDFDQGDRRGRGARREGGVGRDGGGEHLCADATARRHARRGAGSPAGPRGRGAAGGGRAEGRRGAAGAQPWLRRDDGAEALGGLGDGGVLADRGAVDRTRGSRSARCAVRPSRVLRDGLRARCASGGAS